MTNKQHSVDAKVLHTALARMTNDRAIIKQAFNHWLETLSNQPFDVINTVAVLEKYLGLSTQERKVLMVSLHAAGGRSEQELNAVPDYIFSNGSASQGTDSPAVAERQQASKQAFIELTEAYFDLTLAGVRKVDAKDYSDLNAALRDEGLSNVPAALNAKVKTTASDRLSLPNSTSEADCQSLCHELYMLVAEFIGPRQADSVANRAISDLLEMSASDRYDPRKLL